MDCDTIVEFTEDLIRFKTHGFKDDVPVEGDATELQDCIAFVREQFEGSDLYIEKYEQGGKPSLVVSTADTKDIDLMLHAHLDVVYAEDALFEPERKDGKLYGRGAADDKGGAACGIELMKHLAQHECPPTVALVLVTDEEVLGDNGLKYLLEEEAYRPTFGIVMEQSSRPANYLELIHKQKGAVHVRGTADGTTAHGSSPWNGENAADKIINGYTTLRSNFSTPEEETWEPTLALKRICSNGEGNIPDSAEITFTVYTNEEYTNDAAISDVEAIDEFEHEIVLNASMFYTPPSNPHIQQLQRASGNVLGEPIPINRESPLSDARHFTRNDVPAVKFGPEGYNLHEDDEYLVIESLDDYMDILLNFITAWN